MIFADTVQENGLPCTVSYIAYHAASRPEASAVLFNGQTITYAAFHRDIGRMVQALQELGVKPGQTLALEHSHFYLHWLIILACEALGVTSCSYEAAETPVLDKAFVLCDLVLCPPGQVPPTAARVHEITQDWVDGVLADTPGLPITMAPLAAKTAMRIVKSSGTTGSIKCMHQPWDFRELYLSQYQFRAGFNRDSRFLVTMGLIVEPYNIYASDCVRMGGTCIYDNRVGIAEALAQYAITHIVLPPYVLMQLLDSLSKDYVKAANLLVITIGAPIAKEVRNRVKQHLASDIVESYGAQEIGVVATMDENGLGALLPGVEVEVIGESGQAIFGEPGEVRVRSTVNVGRYIDDPAATAKMFRGDWFYPGDLAVMPDTQTLKIVGRVDDTLNIRGIKFAPDTLEAKLRNELPVHDLCLSARDAADGNQELCVVIVPEDSAASAVIQAKLPQLIPANFGQFHVVTAGSIPRTPTSKIRRAEIRAMLQKG